MISVNDEFGQDEDGKPSEHSQGDKVGYTDAEFDPDEEQEFFDELNEAIEREMWDYTREIEQRQHEECDCPEQLHTIIGQEERADGKFDTLFRCLHCGHEWMVVYKTDDGLEDDLSEVDKK